MPMFDECDLAEWELSAEVALVLATFPAFWGSVGSCEPMSTFETYPDLWA